MVILNSSYAKVLGILEVCIKNALPFTPISVIFTDTDGCKLNCVSFYFLFSKKKAFDLFESQNAQNSDFSLNSPNFFTQLIVDNNVLRNGTICEVCGPPGSGKTQFSFQLCAQLFLNNSNEQADFSIFYIDTENTFSADR